MKDWPRVAKIQSDLLADALATRQMRAASHVHTKCQGVARFPRLGHTEACHHDYTRAVGKGSEACPTASRRLTELLA